MIEMMEGSIGRTTSTTFLDGLIYDLGEGDRSGSLGFMELLGYNQEFGCSSLFDVVQQQQPHSSYPTKIESLSSPVADVFNNQPTTPNSSSISSASSDAVNDEQQVKVGDEEQDDQPKTKKL